MAWYAKDGVWSEPLAEEQLCLSASSHLLSTRGLLMTRLHQYKLWGHTDVVELEVSSRTKAASTVVILATLPATALRLAEVDLDLAPVTTLVTAPVMALDLTTNAAQLVDVDVLVLPATLTRLTLEEDNSQVREVRHVGTVVV